MANELPASHSKCSESHTNGTKLSYFSIINLTVVRCRGTWRCSDAIKFGMKSLSAIAQNWFTESGASWCRRLNAKSSNTYEVNCIYGRVTCGAKRKYPFFKWKCSLIIKSVMNLYGKEKISIHTEVVIGLLTSCCSTNIWADIIFTIYYSLDKFDWGVRCVIIFLYVQLWIRLGTISYRDKKVRTVDSHAVRSVNKSRDTRNCVQNEPQYAICVLVATRLYYKALGIILCALIQQIRHNYNRLDNANVKLQFTARCQRWARPVPWWQPMKIP